MHPEFHRAHPQPHGHRTLHGLAEGPPVHNNHAQLQAQMLRMWEVRARRSGLPSRGSTLRCILHSMPMPGSARCASWGFRSATISSPIPSDMDLMQASQQSHAPLCPRTVPRYHPSRECSNPLSPASPRCTATLGPSHRQKPNNYLAPSKPHHAPLTRNCTNRANTVWSRTYLSPSPLGTHLLHQPRH